MLCHAGPIAVSIDWAIAVPHAFLIEVELFAREPSLGLPTACPDISKMLESSPAAIVDDVSCVLRFVLWAAGEHGQNTKNESTATYGATSSEISVVKP